KETLDNTIENGNGKTERRNGKESYRSSQRSPREKNNIIDDKAPMGIENETKDKDKTNGPYKIEESKAADIMKRVLEKNKKEAAVRHREFFSNFPQSYMNLNSNMNQTQGKFFIGSSGLGGQNRAESHSRPFSTDQKAPLNYLEFIFKDILL